MRKDFLKNGMVLGIIFLFVGASLLPSIGSLVVEKSSMPSFYEKTLYVGGSGPDNYTKIQDAIDNASDGDTVYVYSGNYGENVVVDKSINLIGEDKNTTVIDGGGSGDVIIIIAEGCKLTGFTIKNSGNFGWKDAGIEILSSRNNIIKENILDNNQEGIFLRKSSNNIIQDNMFIKNSINFYPDPNLSHYFHTIENNTVNGNPLYYYINRSGFELPKDAGQIILVNCTTASINNLNLTDVGMAIILIFCSNVVVNNSILLNNNNEGIWLYNSTECHIINNSISSSQVCGIYLNHSSNNILRDNDISSSYLAASICLESSPNNVIQNNIIKENPTYGIYIWRNSHGNLIFNNTFVNNRDNAWDLCSNQWDNGSVGNYWSDHWYRYDGDHDGISDIPYYIPLTGIDHYPLMPPGDPTPPTMEIEIPKEGYWHIDDRDPGRKTPNNNTIIFALPFMESLTIKVYASSASGIGTVRVYVDANYTRPEEDFIKLVPTYPGSDLYTGKMNNWLFGTKTLTFVAFNKIGVSNVQEMDIFFIYFPRPS